MSPGGLNYGWRCREGNQNYNFSGNCSLLTFVEPFHTYTHGQGLSITGGYVYRGCQIPTLDGTYFFADYVSARIWTTDAGGSTANLTERTSELAPSGAGSIARITTFGVDQRGEMYIADQGTGVSGEIFKVVAADPTISDSDLNCSGSVDFQDLLIVLAAWGPCDGCLADLDGNHQVDFDDVLALLAQWG